jgi:hypothetical protein
MSDQLSIDLFGILHGTAHGRLAIGALVFITLVVAKRGGGPDAHRQSKLSRTTALSKIRREGALDVIASQSVKNPSCFRGIE